MRKRILSLVLSICFLFPLLPAKAQEVVLSADFETESSLWLGGTISPDAMHDGESGLLIASPLGGETNAGFANILEYNSSVLLEEGKIYRLSFWVKTLEPADGNRSNSVSVNGGNLTFEIQTITNEWKEVVVNFIAPSSRDYSLDLLLYTAVENPTLMVDSFTLTATDTIPASYSLIGRKTLTIPPVGENTYRYRLDALDEEGNRISSPLTEFEVQNPPAGVTFDASSATIAVSDTAEDGTTFTLAAKIPGQSPIYHTITLTKNLLVNSNFEDSPQWFGWDQEFSRLYEEFDGENHYLRLEPSDGSDSDSYASIRQENPVTLIGGELYVLRARVHSTDEVPESFLYTQNTSWSSDTSVTIDISGIRGSEWKEIFCAIRPEVTGNYEIILNFHTSRYQPIYIDDVTLTQEELALSEIYFSAPGHIARPRTDIEFFPIAYATLDQEGNPFGSGGLIPSVYPDDGTILLDPDNNLLIVTPEVSCGEYTLTLSSLDGTVHSSTELTVSDNKLGDGSFEEKIAGKWWAAQSPSELTILSVSGNDEPVDGYRMARLDLSGEVTAVLSNSYATYYSDETYVFHASLKKGYSDVETVLTAVLADQYGEYTYLASESISPNGWNEISAVFSPTEELTGRLILFLSVLSDQYEQRVLLDDVSIEQVSVSAENAELFGTPTVGDTLVVSYDFISNFETADASLVRWHVSDSEYGPFSPIDSAEQTALFLSSELGGRYVRAEIIPISLIGGFLGESVWSDAMYIFPSEALPPDDFPTEEPTPDVPSVPTEEPSQAPLVPLPLPEEIGNILLLDIDTHWAKQEILEMSTLGVVTGYANNCFNPDASITRAEFTALLVRAFGLAPTAYSGRFTDVSASDWYAGIIETAYQYSLVNGISDTEFSPNAQITREQMAVMIMRAYKAANGESVNATHGVFYDELEVSSWAIEAVEEASTLGIIRGTSPSLFSPKDAATRAQSAVMIKRLLLVLNQ